MDNMQGVFRMTKKQVRNRWSSAGITEREADRLLNYASKIEKIANKNNLYVGYERELKRSIQIIMDVLKHADRI